MAPSPEAAPSPKSSNSRNAPSNSSSSSSPTPAAAKSSPPPPPEEKSSNRPPAENSSNSPPEEKSSNRPPAENSSNSPPARNSSSPPPARNSSSPPPSQNSSPPPAQNSNRPPEGNKSNPPPSRSAPPQQATQKSPPPTENNNNRPKAPQSTTPPTPAQWSSSPPPSSPQQQNFYSSPVATFAAPQGDNNNNDNNKIPSLTLPTQQSSAALSPATSYHSSGTSSSSSPTDSSSRSDSSPSRRHSSGGDNNGDTGKIVAGASVGAGLVIIMVVLLCVVCRRKKKKKHQFYTDPAKGGQQYYNNAQGQPWQNNPQGPDHVVMLSQEHGGGWGTATPPMGGGNDGGLYSADPLRSPIASPSPNMAFGLNQSTFTYEELATATRGFAQANLLGQGGFGYVHKGVLPNGKEVAVKSLKAGSGQGEREFQAEVDIISRVHHRYLVSLVGYCIADEKRMLVYEFVSNSTLEYHLHDKSLPVMEFSTRLRIALGSAKGLAYIHEDCHPRIIHRDIKAANILLDCNFDAKVADFGLAKLSSDTHTHVSTRVMGTFGYLAPEYASSGKLTEKSDVFSFGIMLLELITGKLPVDTTNTMEDSLVDWARPLLKNAMEDGNFSELEDPRLEGNYNPQEMARMVTCAAASIRYSARKRPKMSQIVRALERDVSLDDLDEGVKPGHSTVFQQGVTSDYSQSTYEADMKKFRQLALASADFSSGEYGPSSNDSREMTPGSKPNTNI